MITAALMAAIKLFEDAEIHILTSAEGQRVVRDFHANVTQILTYDRRSIFSFLQKKKLNKKIVEEKYTDIFCFETNPSYLRLFQNSDAVVHTIENYTFEDSYARQCLQQVSQAAGAQDHNEWIYLPVSPADVDKANRIFAEHDISEQAFIVGLHPSFSGLRKLAMRSQIARHQRGWPPEHFAKLARLLHEYALEHHLKLHIVIDLLAEEKALGDEIVEKSGGVITLLTPTPDFGRYKGTLKRYNLLVSPNTGPMHIAAAVGTPVIGLFAGEKAENSGAYVDESRFTALAAEHTEHSELGLAAITPEMVFAACKPFLPI
jgi:ADP-heptose:LPS heptosyltransferase